MVLNGPVAINFQVEANAGTLVVNNSLVCGGQGYPGAAPVTVGPSGTLSGSGNISVAVSSSGTIAPSGTLTMSALSLASGGILNYTLGGASDSLLAIGGNLTLSSGITVNVTDGGSFGEGVYPLATFGSLTDNSSCFSGWTLNAPAVPGHVSYVAVGPGNTLNVDVFLAGISGSWSGTSGGIYYWADVTQWDGEVVPTTGVNQVPASATFGNSIGGQTVTVLLDGANQTLGSLTISNSLGGSYIIDSTDGSTLTLAASNAPAQVTISGGGSHTIAAPVTLSGAVNVSGDTNSLLTFSGNIDGNGPLMIGGSGTVSLNGTNSTYGGGTIVNGGTLSLGPGYVGGWSGVGKLVGTGPVTVNAGGTLIGQNVSLGMGYSGWNGYQANST